MRRHYMRIRSVKDSKSFDKYLKSKSTEELIFCSSTVNDNTNYSHLNREITFELPNEFLNNFNDLLIDPKTFEQEFKQNLEEHFNITISDYTLAIHNPDKDFPFEQNLHCHFIFNSYSVKKVVDKSKPLVLKSDTYFYLKSGKVMKDKKKYDENNPNHVFLPSGSSFIDFEKAKELTFDFDEMERTEQFKIRRYVMENYQIDKTEEYKFVTTNDFNYFSNLEKKERTNNFNDYLVNSFNNSLETLGFDKKYITRSMGQELGLKSQIKHNLRGNRDPDDKGLDIRDENTSIEIQNIRKIREKILDMHDIIKDKVVDTFALISLKRKKKQEEEKSIADKHAEELVKSIQILYNMTADKFNYWYEDGFDINSIEMKAEYLFKNETNRNLDWNKLNDIKISIDLVDEYGTSYNHNNELEENINEQPTKKAIKKKKVLKLR
jgi:hypothetical protein